MASQFFPKSTKQSTATKQYAVLLMDDDAGIRKALKTRLESANYSVQTANNGAEALQSFKEHGPDLVILDINVPDSDGFEICQSIKQIKNTPVIFLSGEQTSILQEHMSEMVESVGAEFFLGKPFDGKLLLRLVAEVLEKYDKP